MAEIPRLCEILRNPALRSCFGYRSRRTPAGMIRVIEPSEAAVIRKIFALCAAGKGARRIAKDLNANGDPSAGRSAVGRRAGRRQPSAGSCGAKSIAA